MSKESLPLGVEGGLRSNSDEMEKNKDCYTIYTSPPPTAEPRLEEKSLKVASKPYDLQENEHFNA